MGWYREGLKKDGTANEDSVGTVRERLPLLERSTAQEEGDEGALAFEKRLLVSGERPTTHWPSYKFTRTAQATDEGGFFTPQEESLSQGNRMERKLQSLRAEGEGRRE